MSSNDDPSKRTAFTNLAKRRIEVEEAQEPAPVRDRPLRSVELAPLPINEVLALRDAPPPPPGYRYTMDGRLVPAVESELSIEDPKAQELFCEIIEKTGSLRAACDALGIKSMSKVKRYIERNPDFFEDVEGSAERHRQALYAHAIQRATVGYQKPIIGGKDKDKIVGYEQVVSDGLLTLLLKRHFVEFREAAKTAPTTPININLGNNLRNVPKEKRDELRRILKDNPPTPDPSGIIDVDPDPNKN